MNIGGEKLKKTVFRKCEERIKFLSYGVICFGVGVLSTLFLPSVFMITVEALIVCAVGILFIL